MPFHVTAWSEETPFPFTVYCINGIWVKWLQHLARHATYMDVGSRDTAAALEGQLTALPTEPVIIIPQIRFQHHR